MLNMMLYKSYTNPIQIRYQSVANPLPIRYQSVANPVQVQVDVNPCCLLVIAFTIPFQKLVVSMMF